MISLLLSFKRRIVIQSNKMAIFADAKLGRCSRCIRKSFVAAAAGFLTLALINQIAIASRFLIPVEIVTLMLSVLWIAHLVAWAKRAGATQESAAARETQKSDTRLLSRRAALPVFAKSLAAIAIASALPRLANASACSKTCPDGTSASNSCDAPTPFCHCSCAGGANCYCSTQ
jgi:hypothetical protein